MTTTRKTKSRRTKPYWEMNTAELAAATREFDKEDLRPDQPLTGNMLRDYRRAKAKRGRPRIGSGSKAITITVEKKLLGRIDKTAKKQGVTRSQFIARALQQELSVRSA